MHPFDLACKSPTPSGNLNNPTQMSMRYLSREQKDRISALYQEGGDPVYSNQGCTRICSEINYRLMYKCYSQSHIQQRDQKLASSNQLMISPRTSLLTFAMLSISS